MAVYTDIAAEELEAFLTDYDLGALTSVKGIAEGVENSNYLVSTERGTFILTLYEKRVQADDLPFFLGLLDHLSSRGLKCPTPVKDKAGQARKTLAGRPAAMVTFLEGVSVRRPNVGHCAGVGEALARLHLAAQDFPLERPNALSLPAWRPLLESSGTQANDVLHGLYDDLDRELSALEHAWPSGLPGGVIHADLFPDNVFFLKGKTSGLIDFYFACNDALAYDVAVCLNAWCFEPDGSFNVTKAKALTAAYGQVRRLEADEIAALPILCRGAAVRFLLTRLYDWLTTPEGALVTRKDPLEYLKKLRFHRRIVNARDYGVAG